MQACHNIAPPLSSCCASIYILSATAAALPQPVCRFVSRVHVRKCKVKKKQGRKRCARAKTEVLLFEHRTRLSMLGGDPLDKCTLPVRECYVLTLRTLLTKCYFSNAKQARSEWECARFIYPRYELLYELRRVETAATAGTAVMHQQVTNKHQPPGLS